jgi:hypothetical protein
MTTVYLDTNVYDHIAKGLIPAEPLIDARRRGEVTGHLSAPNVEELLGDWERDSEAAVKRLQLADHLVGFENFLKQPADLLRDAIYAYATATPPPPPLLPRKERRRVASGLRRITERRPGTARAVAATLAKVRRDKEEFRATMRRARDQALAELGDPNQFRNIEFGEFWERAKAGWAEAVADGCGLAAQCRARGLEGLLEVRTVRLAVGAALSLVYAQTVERGRPDIGDGHDLQHAIAASTADVFVSRDKPFTRLLKRIPMDGFRVVDRLEEILAPSPTSAQGG